MEFYTASPSRPVLENGGCPSRIISPIEVVENMLYDIEALVDTMEVSSGIVLKESFDKARGLLGDTVKVLPELVHNSRILGLAARLYELHTSPHCS